jgi:hypothetical protein
MFPVQLILVYAPLVMVTLTNVVVLHSYLCNYYKQSVGLVYLYDLINIKKHQYYFRYSNTTELPQVRTTRYGINSFRYTASKLWNEYIDVS